MEKLDRQGEQAYEDIFNSIISLKSNLQIIAGTVQNPVPMSKQDLLDTFDQIELVRTNLVTVIRKLGSEYERQFSLSENKSDL